MTSYKDFLTASAPVAAWSLDSLGSSDPDLSMNGLTSLVNVSDKSAAPIVPGTNRCYTIRSSIDNIKYPHLNIWNKNNVGVPFSIEFVVKPVVSQGRVMIFAPRSSSSLVNNNNISISNNKLSFFLSDGEKTYEAYALLDFIGGTYHCVASYEPSSISLYVNGEKVSSVELDKNFFWNFLDDQPYGFETIGTPSSIVMLSSLSVSKGSFNVNSLLRRYRSLMYRDGASNIAKRYGGRVFNLDDSNRIKSFYFNDPQISQWSDVMLDNLSVINNKLMLDEIYPPELNTGVASFVTSHLSLSTSQSLIIENLEKYTSSTSGSIGFYFRYTAARHGAHSSGELSLVSITNAEASFLIEVVEKSDKKLYMRYTSNGISSADTLLASPSTGSDSDNYIYLSFSPNEIVCYLNDDITTATIDISSIDGMGSPTLTSGSHLTIGATPDNDQFWGSHVWWLNIWNYIKDINDLASFKDEVYQYTLKMINSLKVSQTGYATWELDTGTPEEEVDPIVQSRIWWAPEIPEEYLKIEAGTSPIAVTAPPPPPGDNDVYEDLYADNYGITFGAPTTGIPYGIDYGSSYGVASGGYTVPDNMAEVDGAGNGDPVPETIYIRATISTDDSVNNISYLKKIGVDIFTNSDVIMEDGLDKVLFNSVPFINFSKEHIGTQEFHTGAKITSPDSACRIYSPFSGNPMTDNTDLPEVSDTNVPATELNVAKTVEFWAKILPSTSGYVFKYKGTDEHSLSIDSNTLVFTCQGFDFLYIDGNSIQLTGGVTAPQASDLFNKWHLFHLVMLDSINQTDATTFPAVSGTPVIGTDSSKFYYGLKSFKMTSTGASDYIRLYSNTTGIGSDFYEDTYGDLYGQAGVVNPISSTHATVSFMVYPDTGVTQVRTDYIQDGTPSIVTHNVTPNSWNLIERTVSHTSPPLTTLEIRLGPVSASQTIWVDGASLVSGRDAFIRFSNDGGGANTSWFGYDVDDALTTQATMDLQTLALYPQAFSGVETSRNFKTYSGNFITSLNANVVDRMPSSGTSLSEPSVIVNRNPDPVDVLPGEEAEGDVLFQENPIFLSSAWNILSLN